jgi:hypothetical protein
MNPLWIAMGLTVFAGMATGIWVWGGRATASL